MLVLTDHTWNCAVEPDPDHEPYHGVHGRVVGVVSDAAGLISGDQRDSRLYRVALDTGEKADFRWRDLRPPIKDSTE